MCTTTSRFMPILAMLVSIAISSAYNERVQAQNQSQPAVAPNSSASTATTTGTTNTSQPVPPQNTGQNQPAMVLRSTSPSAATTFQMQTPSGGGTPQTAGALTFGNQPTAGQPFQQAIVPQGQLRLNPQFGPSGAVTGRIGVEVPANAGVNVPINGPLNATTLQGAVPAFVAPGIGFDVTDQGLTINALEPNGLFYRSGLRRGDVIVSALGQPIQNEADFMRLAGLNPVNPDGTIPVVVRRGGQLQTINVTYPQIGALSYLGVEFDVQTTDRAVVRWIAPKSPAEVAGLRPGDTIEAINGVPIRSYQHAMQVIAATQSGEGVDIKFARRVENYTRAILQPAPVSQVQTARSAAESQGR